MRIKLRDHADRHIGKKRTTRRTNTTREWKSVRHLILFLAAEQRVTLVRVELLLAQEGVQLL